MWSCSGYGRSKLTERRQISNSVGFMLDGALRPIALLRSLPGRNSIFLRAAMIPGRAHSVSIQGSQCTL